MARKTDDDVSVDELPPSHGLFLQARGDSTVHIVKKKACWAHHREFWPTRTSAVGLFNVRRDGCARRIRGNCSDPISYRISALRRSRKSGNSGPNGNLRTRVGKAATYSAGRNRIQLTAKRFCPALRTFPVVGHQPAPSIAGRHVDCRSRPLIDSGLYTRIWPPLAFGLPPTTFGNHCRKCFRPAD